MTKEQRQHLIDVLTSPDMIDDYSADESDELADLRLEYCNDLTKCPEYIAAVNTVVDLLDQYSNIGQVEKIINLMSKKVFKEAIRLINV